MRTLCLLSIMVVSIFFFCSCRKVENKVVKKEAERKYEYVGKISEEGVSGFFQVYLQGMIQWAYLGGERLRFEPEGDVAQEGQDLRVLGKWRGGQGKDSTGRGYTWIIYGYMTVPIRNQDIIIEEKEISVIGIVEYQFVNKPPFFHHKLVPDPNGEYFVEAKFNADFMEKGTPSDDRWFLYSKTNPPNISEIEERLVKGFDINSPTKL